MHSSGATTKYPIFTHVTPVLPTTDVKQACIFYEHLGFQTLHYAADYAIFGRDSIQLHVWLCPNPSIAGNSSCRIGVRGIEALYQDLLALGLLKPDASVTQKPWGSYEFEVFSPEQVIITFVEQGTLHQRERRGRPVNKNPCNVRERSPTGERAVFFESCLVNGKVKMIMSGKTVNTSTLLAIAPRFRVSDLEQALAFYEQLGFVTTYHDEEFAIVSRDGIDLHLNYSADHPTGFHSVCWIGVSDSEALYQQYLPTNAICSPLKVQLWGFQEFLIRDPFGNGLLFAERLRAYSLMTLGLLRDSDDSACAVSKTKGSLVCWGSGRKCFLPSESRDA